MWRGTEKNKRKNTGKQSKANKQRETSTGKERNKGHLHWVKEEEHDEERDRSPKGKTHRLHAVQGCHTVLSPAKYILVLDFEMFFAHRIFVLLAFCTLFWGFNLFFGGQARHPADQNHHKRLLQQMHLVIFSFVASLRACAQCAHVSQNGNGIQHVVFISASLQLARHHLTN